MAEEVSCRFYERKLPEVGEIVIGKITKITDLGVYVELLEYDRLEGLIIVGELSKKKFRSVNQLVKLGKIEVGVVTRVDTEREYIDLSRKKVSPVDLKNCLVKYSMNRLSHSVMVLAAKNLGMDLLELYKEFGWKKAREHKSLYNFFFKTLKSPELLEDEPFGKEIGDCIKKKFTLSKYKVRADINITCQTGGVASIKEALMEARSCSYKIQVQLVTPPTYSIFMTSSDKEESLALVQDACHAVCKKIKSLNGTFSIASEAQIYRDRKNIDTFCAKFDELDAEAFESELSNEEVV
jgi:translation initiation factor 2 subunit 1